MWVRQEVVGFDAEWNDKKFARGDIKEFRHSRSVIIGVTDKPLNARYKGSHFGDRFLAIGLREGVKKNVVALKSDPNVCVTAKFGDSSSDEQVG